MEYPSYTARLRNVFTASDGSSPNSMVSVEFRSGTSSENGEVSSWRRQVRAAQTRVMMVSAPDEPIRCPASRARPRKSATATAGSTPHGTDIVPMPEISRLKGATSRGRWQTRRWQTACMIVPASSTEIWCPASRALRRKSSTATTGSVPKGTTMDPTLVMFKTNGETSMGWKQVTFLQMASISWEAPAASMVPPAATTWSTKRARPWAGSSPKGSTRVPTPLTSRRNGDASRGWWQARRWHTASMICRAPSARIRWPAARASRRNWLTMSTGSVPKGTSRVPTPEMLSRTGATSTGTLHFFMEQSRSMMRLALSPEMRTPCC
mmetsp:Transcript_8829/g.25150  ORF Transcript_8829/g.25150 Transcript_8829/m.25150 type:complete len:323 (-) Transcript_8829:1288-2256(-)